jgi:membrane-bound ClpP family serine protease
MEPIYVWLIILITVALAMFVAELFVPSGGLLAIGGALALTVAVILCFVINRWVGVGVLVAIVLIAPFAVHWGIGFWQKTPIGKRMVLTATVGELPRTQVLVGSVGVALTEMRPMGEVEVGETRIEAQSEMGRIIPAGRQVKILSLTDGVATVREVMAENV